MIPSSQPDSASHDYAALVKEQVQRINTDFRLQPVTASEIEFFLVGADACASMPAFWDDVRAACEKNDIHIHQTGSETGREQFEISLKPCPDAAKTAQDTLSLKHMVSAAAAQHGMEADFSSRPFADRPGSGLHLHVHLTDSKNKNVFFKNDESISAALQHSIGGLMVWLNPCMPFFAPHAECYTRFVPKSTAPVTVSWGANNRTVAIRLPQAAHDNKRIEHRVAGADADPMLVMAVILAAIHFGIRNQCNPGAQIFGDASLPMYNLPPIAASLEEAVARMRDSKVFEGYFNPEDLLPVPLQSQPQP